VLKRDLVTDLAAAIRLARAVEVISENPSRQAAPNSRDAY
jgi:hypothetical protein